MNASRGVLLDKRYIVGLNDAKLPEGEDED